MGGPVFKRRFDDGMNTVMFNQYTEWGLNTFLDTAQENA